MSTQRGRRRVWRAALVAAFAALVAHPGVAFADHTTYTVPEDKLGYSACAWPAGQVVSVAVDPAYPLPDLTFSARLDDAVIRWNEVISTSNRGGGFVRKADGPADVLVQYRSTETTDSHDVLAETYLQRQGDADLSPNIGRCPDRQPVRFTMVAAQVRMNPRSDWWTGPDSEVGVWQMCVDPSFRAPNSSTCAQSVDFGSTLIHELGHALVLYHPQTLDDIDGIPVDRADSSSSQAACVEATGSFDAQATLCAGQGLYRAEQRTLETWDIESVHRLYNGPAPPPPDDGTGPGPNRVPAFLSRP